MLNAWVKEADEMGLPESIRKGLIFLIAFGMRSRHSSEDQTEFLKHAQKLSCKISLKAPHLPQGAGGNFYDAKIAPLLAELAGRSLVSFSPRQIEMTPHGNEAVERCPICKRLNNPGACDTCVHFFGSCWDGDIIWSNQFEEFSTEWTELGELVEELTQSLGKSWEKLLQLTKSGISTPKIKALDPSDCSASTALMDLVVFDFGPRIVTDGMLSGEGKSLYLKNANLIEETISAIRLIRKKVEALRPAT